MAQYTLLAEEFTQKAGNRELFSLPFDSASWLPLTSRKAMQATKSPEDFIETMKVVDCCKCGKELIGFGNNLTRIQERMARIKGYKEKAYIRIDGKTYCRSCRMAHEKLLSE